VSHATWVSPKFTTLVSLKRTQFSSVFSPCNMAQYYPLHRHLFISQILFIHVLFSRHIEIITQIKCKNEPISVSEGTVWVL
jgi:hypothetical protein